MTLRTKLVLALVACTTLAAAAVGALSYRATAQRLVDEVDSSLSQAVDSAARAVGRRPAGAPPRGFAPPGDIHLQLLGPAGGVRVVAGGSELPVDDADRTLAAAGARGLQRVRDESLDGTSVRLLTQSLGDGVGAVQAARSTEEIERVLAALRGRILLLSAAVAWVAGLVGWLIARQITQRLRAVTAAAEEVASTGTLAVAVPVEGSDESARLGGAFNEMLAALARSRADQQRLVQDAGHELRTPMTSLRTNVYALRSFETLDPVQRERALDDLTSEAEELSHLMDEVVALASDQRSDEEPEEIDCVAVARRVAARATGRWDREVAVTAPEPGRFMITARPSALTRAVGNLVENACKFDDSGSPVEIWVEPVAVSAAETAAVSVRVADRGPGIAVDDLPHVFDRFHRSVAARSLPGSGLGLAIVAEVAVAHGGTVMAENRPGGGAIVGLSLPAG